MRGAVPPFPCMRLCHVRGRLYSYESIFHNLRVLAKHTVLHWYGHVQRMEEGRLPKEVTKWSPPGRRKRGRPKLTWAEGIRGLMGEKGLIEEDWNDRGKRRKKII